MSMWKKQVWLTGRLSAGGWARTLMAKSRASLGREGEPVAKTRKRRRESTEKAAMALRMASGTTEVRAKPRKARQARTSSAARSSLEQSMTRQSVEEKSLRKGAASGESSARASSKPLRSAVSDSSRQPVSTQRTLSTTNSCLFASVTGRGSRLLSEEEEEEDASSSAPWVVASAKSRPQSVASAGGGLASMFSRAAPSAGSNWRRSRMARASPAATWAAPRARNLKSEGASLGGAPQPS
mmetsp:Transcript_6952/g.21496  ORF Transcript_6952/g.21496 Transcript_6952/m.21496 type:complete len:240 (-) Transcript_6952:394-1113(-)